MWFRVIVSIILIYFPFQLTGVITQGASTLSFSVLYVLNMVFKTIVCILLASQVFSIDVIDYVPVGCYKDIRLNRALPTLLANYRVKNAKWPDILDWTDLENSVIKKCATKAKERGYSFFGIQFYGECWSGSASQSTYAKHGLSKRCTTAAPYVGKDHANFVYMLTEENECKSYKIFDDASRSQFHVTNYGRPIRCDNGQLDENRWYRFTGQAGSAMADQCVPSSRCQTFGTGWYSGSYPQVSDGIQEGDVCFKWDGNCCSKKVNIRIRNCSSFFVYKLNNKISCQYAYCGNGQWLGEVFSNETGSELTHCISQSFLTLLSAQHSWYQDNIFIYNILSRF